jgi:tRNA A-37 threonylcarbamoyl transferase component Bud32
VETRTAPLIGGRYRIDGALGEGGMARVFAAYDERLQRQVAVKVLRVETRSLPGMQRRFQQEALIAARLTHPHIVAVLDFGEDDATSYLVMERLPGQTLRDEIVTRGCLPEGRVALVMEEMLAALASAHGRGVLHRDIKPSNILLQQDGHTKITDFGIAKSVDARAEPLGHDDMTMTGVVLGTPGYLAPERRTGQPATVQSDLYGAGAVMVEALTGRRLAPGPVPTEVLPPRWRAVASRALATDPRLRYPSADDMLQALRAGGPRPGTAPAVPATAHLPRPPRPPGPRPRAHARRRRMAWAVVATVLLSAALTILALDLAQPTGPASTAARQHHRAGPHTQAVTRHTATTTTTTTDPLSGAISALATALANGGLPGDGALASALQSTAASPAGADQQAAAEQALSLAGVLLDGGGISARQYQNVIDALQPTGATTTTVPGPAAPPQVPGGGGHSPHDHGGDGGAQG